MLRTITQILIYTRPWEVRFHLALARQLEGVHPGVPVVFYTFFRHAYDQVLSAGRRCVYFPQALAEVSVAGVGDERLGQIDDELAQAGLGNLLLQFHAERFRPADRLAQQDMLRRHVAVLDAAVRPGTLGISSMFDHFVYWLAGSLAEARNGAHFAFVGAPMPPGRVQALRTPWEQWVGPEVPEADSLYDSCRAQQSLPPEQRIAYMRPETIPPLRRRWRERLREVQDDLADRRAGAYFGPASFTWRKSVETRWRRIFPANDDAQYDLRTPEEVRGFSHRSVYVPLHMEPEATILMYSPWLQNQVEMCRLVSQALPPDVWMLVKENPKMIGARSAQFFRDIKAIPNLRLVHPTVNPFVMTEKCDLTITLAGTAALEAKLLGKRVAMLARPPHAFVLESDEILGVEIKAAQIQRLLRRAPKEMSRSHWHRFIRGTFVGQAVPVWGTARYELDSSEENARQYSGYIAACLSQPADNERDPSARLVRPSN